MDATRQDGSPAVPSGFKSPLRLLVRCFRKSQQQWKGKAVDRRAKIKDLEHRVRDIDKSRASWRSKAQQLDAAQKTLEERLRVVEAERDQLQAKVEELESKKPPRPVVR
jgi:septal ring factor EnvC (AmiA/AmiB activator)